MDLFIEINKCSRMLLFYLRAVLSFTFLQISRFINERDSCSFNYYFSVSYVIRVDAVETMLRDQ